MDILKGIIDDKVLRIIKLFISNADEFFHINKVSQEAKVPLATTFRIIKQLLENKIIEYKQISKFKIYKLARNKKTKQLKRIL